MTKIIITVLLCYVFCVWGVNGQIGFGYTGARLQALGRNLIRLANREAGVAVELNAARAGSAVIGETGFISEAAAVAEINAARAASEAAAVGESSMALAARRTVPITVPAALNRASNAASLVENADIVRSTGNAQPIIATAARLDRMLRLSKKAAVDAGAIVATGLGVVVVEKGVNALISLNKAEPTTAIAETTTAIAETTAVPTSAASVIVTTTTPKTTTTPEISNPIGQRRWPRTSVPMWREKKVFTSPRPFEEKSKTFTVTVTFSRFDNSRAITTSTASTTTAQSSSVMPHTVRVCHACRHRMQTRINTSSTTTTTTTTAVPVVAMSVAAETQTRGSEITNRIAISNKKKPTGIGM